MQFRKILVPPFDRLCSPYFVLYRGALSGFKHLQGPRTSPIVILPTCLGMRPAHASGRGLSHGYLRAVSHASSAA